MKQPRADYLDRMKVGAQVIPLHAGTTSRPARLMTSWLPRLRSISCAWQWRRTLPGIVSSVGRSRQESAACADAGTSCPLGLCRDPCKRRIKAAEAMTEMGRHDV
jgi:hypothetical protein